MLRPCQLAFLIFGGAGSVEGIDLYRFFETVPPCQFRLYYIYNIRVCWQGVLLRTFPPFRFVLSQSPVGNALPPASIL